jgi:hypothetical protein
MRDQHPPTFVRLGLRFGVPARRQLDEQYLGFALDIRLGRFELIVGGLIAAMSMWFVTRMVNPGPRSAVGAEQHQPDSQQRAGQRHLEPAEG